MEEQDTETETTIPTTEDTRGMDMGSNKDNESTNSLDTTIAFGGSEADGHLANLLPNGQANLSMFTREINSLWH